MTMRSMFISANQAELHKKEANNVYNKNRTKGTLRQNFLLSFVATIAALNKFNSSYSICRVRNFTCPPNQAHRNELAKPKSASERETTGNIVFCSLLPK